MAKLNRLDRDELIHELLHGLTERYGISEAELDRFLAKEPRVPVSIFNPHLSPLEAIVKYLRENEGRRLVEIAKLTGRDQRAIGVTYRRAKNKHPGRLAAPQTRITFPVRLLQDRACSPAEQLVRYLRQQELSFAEIARILNRDDRTIWTVHKRAQVKLKA